MSGAAELSSPSELLASSALDVGSGSLEEAGAVVVVVVVGADVVELFEVGGADVVGVEVVVLDVVEVFDVVELDGDEDEVEVVVPVGTVSGGVDSPPHATLSVAQRVTDMQRRTMNAFLMVYVDERYPEPLPMQQLLHSLPELEVAFFRLAR